MQISGSSGDVRGSGYRTATASDDADDERGRVCFDADDDVSDDSDGSDEGYDDHDGDDGAKDCDVGDGHTAANIES